MPLTLPPLAVLRRVKLPSKRLLILVAGALLGGYFLWWVLLWISFSEESVRDQTIAALEQVLGREVNYAEDTRFSLLPAPKLVLDNVHARNHPRSREPSMIRITQMIVTVNPLSLFSGNLMVALNMQSPRVEMENFDDGSASWRSEEKPEKEQEAEAALISGIDVSDGSLHYHYPLYEREMKLNGINASITLRSAGAFEGAASFLRNGNYYEVHADVAEDGASVLQSNLSLTDGVSVFNLSGVWNKTTQSYEGTQSFETTDMGNFLLNMFLGRTGNQAQQVTEQTAGQAVLPLQWNSKVTYRGSKLELADIAIDGEHISGGGRIEIENPTTPAIMARFDLEKLSLQPLMESGVLHKLLTQKASTEIVEGFSVNLPEGAKNALSKGISLALTLTSKEADVLSMPATNVQLGASMQQGVISLSQFSGKFAGDSQFLLRGYIEDNYEGVALKGQLDVAGDQFSEFFGQAISSEIAIPKRLKTFRGRANLFLTPTLTRLSEGILRIGNLQVLGTLLREQKDKKDALPGNAGPAQDLAPNVSYEGALRIDNLNLDEFNNVQKEEDAGVLADYPKAVRLARKMLDISRGNDIDLKINLIDYKINKQSRPKATVNIVLSNGGIALNNLEASYNGTYFMGSAGIAFPAQSVPEIAADLRADTIDTADLFDHDFGQDENFWRDQSGAWSRKEFDLGWMRKINGTFRLEAGSFTHEAYNLSNLVLEAALKDSVFQLDKLSGGIWGGQLALRGQVSSGKLPSMSCGYTLKGVQIAKLRDVTALAGDLLGNISISGDLGTSGINAITAVQNAQGTVAVAGSGITLSGFNLANMVRAANTVRTVDDIEKLILFADQGGTTTIDVLQGNVTIGGSYLRSPGIMVTTKEGSGSINMQLNLMDWTLNSAITIYLTALQQRSPPYIRLVFAGPLHQAARSLDTQSLESFIAKQAAERILDTQ